MCVCMCDFFFSFFCVVYGKTHANERKKKTLYMQYLKRSTKQKGNFFRNEKCLRDWTTKKKENLKTR